MSSANVLMYVAIGSFVLAAICIVLAVVLFFRLDIRGVVGDLTGKTVAREVQTMRNETKQSEYSHERMKIPHGMTTSTNLSKSKMLDKRRAAKEANKAIDLGVATNTYAMQDENITTVLTADDSATTLLSSDNDATTLLTPDSDATTLLTPDSDATTLLQRGEALTEGCDETTLLTGTEERKKVSFTISDSVVLVHTDEVIA